MAKESSEITSAVLDGIEALDAFGKVHCIGQPDEAQCPSEIVAIMILRTGEYEMGVGGYCFAHLKMLQILADLGKGSLADDTIQ